VKNSLSKRKLERYSRQIILKDIGILGQKKIINSKVLIVGIGGLGSPVADLLARCGVGYIGAIDHDKVDISNLQRQILYTSKDVGKFKVDIFKRRIKLINRDVKVKILKEKASEKNLNKIVKDFDIIVDGTDNFKTKFLINKFSLKYKKKLIIIKKINNALKKPRVLKKTLKNIIFFQNIITLANSNFFLFSSWIDFNNA